MALTKIPRGLLDTGIADSSDATAITIDSSENVTFAGSVTVPTTAYVGTSIVHQGDTNTSIDFAADDIKIYAGGIQHILFDGSIVINEGGADVDLRIESDNNTNAFFLDGATGNIGIGATPKTWNSSWESLQIGERSVFFSQASTTTGIGENVYYDAGGWKAFATATGSLYQLSGGNHHFYTMASVSADATSSPSEKFTILNNGKVGIGINAPSYQLDVRTGNNWGIVHSDGTRKVATYIDSNGNDGLYTINSMPLALGTGGTAQLQLDTAGTLRVGNPAGVPTPGSGWDANLDAIQVGEASAFRSGDSDYSAATYVSTNLYQTGGGDKLLNGTDFAAQYVQQGGNHYFYTYENGSANATPAAASNDLANPLLIYKGGGLQISGGSAGNTANGKAGIFWGGAPQDGADYCIRRTNDAWSGSNYAQLLIDWDTGVKIDVGNNAYGKSFLEVNGPITTFPDFEPHDYGDLTDWSTKGISVNLHPSLEASGNAIDHCDNARNMGIRALVHQSTTSSTNRPTGYGTIWCDQHYYSNLSGSKGAAYVMQKVVGHSATPLEYRRNTSTSNGQTWGSWYTVDHTAVSDVREKKNIVDAPDQLENLKKIRVRKFDFKNEVEPDDQLGMIAQELDTTLPEYVWKQYDKDTGEVLEDLMWRIRYKDMIPMLIKSIQELSAEVEALKAK